MKNTLTETLVNDMIAEAKINFLASDRPRIEKKLLKEINPFIYFNNHLRSTWGRAYICNSHDPDRYIIGIDTSVKRVIVEGRKCWFVLEINPGVQYAPIKEVRDTVSHEMAHLLDFRLEGYYNRRNDPHHEGWKQIHLAMGGTGETHGPSNIDLTFYRKYCNIR